MPLHRQVLIIACGCLAGVATVASAVHRQPKITRVNAHEDQQGVTRIDPFGHSKGAKAYLFGPDSVTVTGEHRLNVLRWLLPRLSNVTYPIDEMTSFRLESPRLKEDGTVLVNAFEHRKVTSVLDSKTSRDILVHSYYDITLGQLPQPVKPFTYDVDEAVLQALRNGFKKDLVFRGGDIRKVLDGLADQLNNAVIPIDDQRYFRIFNVRIQKDGSAHVDANEVFGEYQSVLGQKVPPMNMYKHEDKTLKELLNIGGRKVKLQNTDIPDEVLEVFENGLPPK